MKFLALLWSGRNRQLRQNLKSVRTEREIRAAQHPRTGHVSPTGRPRV